MTIVAPQRRADADRDRFLALALMQRARHESLQEQLIEVLLVAADEHHRRKASISRVRRRRRIVARRWLWPGIGRSRLPARRVQTLGAHGRACARRSLAARLAKIGELTASARFVAQLAHEVRRARIRIRPSLDHLRRRPVAERLHFARRLVGLHDEAALGRP